LAAAVERFERGEPDPEPEKHRHSA